MSQVVVATPDFISIVTNGGVFIATAGAAIAAVWGAVKKIKSVMPETANATKVVGGVILDNGSIRAWTDSNKEAAESNRDLQKEIMELRFAVLSLKDKIK